MSDDHVEVLAALPDVGAFPATLVPAEVARPTRTASACRSDRVMRAGRLHARLDKLMPRTKRGRIVTIFPEDWSAEAQMNYDEAVLAGDTERQAAIILQETGEIVNFVDGSVVRLIEIRTADYELA